jgi:cobalamin biosynthesis protein CobT
MSGSKFETACASAAALALALKPLHISYNVLGFTNDCERNEDPIVWVFNDWQENVAQSELVKRFGVASSALWNNSDGDAVAWAHNYLVPRKEKRKILIVLSDGSPAGRSWAGDISSYTKKVTTSIEDKKLVELYGIGIMDTNVKMYYKNNVVIQDTNALAPAILSIIDKAL